MRSFWRSACVRAAARLCMRSRGVSRRSAAAGDGREGSFQADAGAAGRSTHLMEEPAGLDVRAVCAREGPLSLEDRLSRSVPHGSVASFLVKFLESLNHTVTRHQKMVFSVALLARPNHCAWAPPCITWTRLTWRMQTRDVCRLVWSRCALLGTRRAYANP